jgi:hypothetical protein
MIRAMMKILDTVTKIMQKKKMEGHGRAFIFTLNVKREEPTMVGVSERG